VVIIFGQKNNFNIRSAYNTTLPIHIQPQDTTIFNLDIANPSELVTLRK